MSLWSKYNRNDGFIWFEGIKRANPTLLGEGQQDVYIPLIDKMLLKDNVPVQYQHLLRLCGLDELAVNFKI